MICDFCAQSFVILTIYATNWLLGIRIKWGVIPIDDLFIWL
jgi:hypothetical protein